MKCEECGHPTESHEKIEKVMEEGPEPGVNRHYDIPYLAGYSKDGSTIYIDRHFPRYMDYSGKKVDISPFIEEHEKCEMRLIHKLGFHYLHAHHIAEHEEDEKAVWMYGKDFLKAYNKHCDKYIKKCADEKITKVPKNLDLTPYIDEKDKDIQKLKDAMV